MDQDRDSETDLQSQTHPPEVEVSEDDPYSHYLSVWDTEESLQERSRAVFLTIQGILITGATFYLESNKGMIIFFAILGTLAFLEWFFDSLSRSKRIAFLKWLIMQHEQHGFKERQIFTSLAKLGPRFTYRGRDLCDSSEFIGIIRSIRHMDNIIASLVSALWVLFISVALTPKFEVRLFGDWLLSIFGGQ